jgi:aspartyl-tRNA(Asn)/glutamyl-tRNA(Gln) amidotransferase subunit C
VAGGFTRDAVASIAALAHLELNEAELDLFARQLGDILAYAEEVRQIDTTGVPPTTSVVAHSGGPHPPVTRHAADRDDVERAGLDREAALAAAPDPARQAGLDVFFRVPRVIG